VKTGMLVVAGLVAILVLSMPQTLGSFFGSHGFETRECEECHVSAVNAGQVMADLNCISCHNTMSNEHHTTSPQCITCHPVADTLSDLAESHRNVMNQALESEVMEGENEACFLCHAGLNVQFSFNRPRFIEFDMVNDNGDWILVNLTTGPAAVWITSNQRNAGSHQWISPVEIQCPACHVDITENISSHYYPSSGHTSEAECSICHKRSASSHAATSMACFEGNCHTDHEGDLIANIRGQPFEYQSNICIGCHNENPDFKNEPSNTHFRVYLEPVYGVERTDIERIT
jgi:hypothetical protein